MRQSDESLKANDIYWYRRYLQQMLVLPGILLFSLYSGLAVANPFATPDDFSAASCPIGHKKYSIENNTSSATTPSLSLWEPGETSRTFNFSENSGNKTFTIKFPILIDADNSNGIVPFYGSNNGVSSNAINLVHNSTRVQTDHSLDITINRPVSKIGYKIQDLDSTSVTRTVSFIPFRTETRIPYIERVDVSTNNGRLTFSSIFHNINAQNNIVTAKEGENCDTNQCTIDATWGYKSANNVANLKHSNEKRETSGSHAIGYSDFYFCLAPPKVVVKKALNGARINDSSDKRDQFEIKVTGGSIVTNSFTTTGEGATTNNNSSVVLNLAENAPNTTLSYTITEKVLNGTALGEIANYNASYVCSNATTGSTTVMPTAAMTYNSTNKTRSFILSNVTYGDEITCTITNTPVQIYTFSGTVFNDNGGIARSINPDTKSDISATFTGNQNYFNGVFDSNETGISTVGLKVRLTDCGANGGTDITGTTPETVSQTPATLGQYKFTVPASALSGKTRVCLVEVEPDPWVYSVDTTTNSREVTLVNNTFNYSNIDFGEVEADYAALVLRKAQYVNDCPSTLNYSVPNINTAGNTNPRTGFSESAIGSTNGTALTPGQCIAYRITATNRSNLSISNFVMRYKLQKKGEDGALVTSTLIGPVFNASDYASNSVSLGQNNPVITIPFVLSARDNKVFYFNTKYGTTSSNP